MGESDGDEDEHPQMYSNIDELIHKKLYEEESPE